MMNNLLLQNSTYKTSSLPILPASWATAAIGSIFFNMFLRNKLVNLTHPFILSSSITSLQCLPRFLQEELSG